MFYPGGVLPSSRLSEEETCVDMYVNCTVNEDCCGFMRCLDFGKFKVEKIISGQHSKCMALCL